MLFCGAYCLRHRHCGLLVLFKPPGVTRLVFVSLFPMDVALTLAVEDRGLEYTGEIYVT